MNAPQEFEKHQNTAIRWPQIHQHLKHTLHHASGSHDFLEQIQMLEKTIHDLVTENVDASLLVLVQMLYEKNLSYSASHALLCAALCKLLNTHTELPPEELTSLCQAALTMNIGMLNLHDQLAHQKSAITAAQRTAIHNHPEMGWQMLRRKGVEDEVWLQIVRDHHTAREQTTHTPTRMLQLTDVFVGSISPRSTRPGLLSKQGALRIYKAEDCSPNSLGAAFVKSIGIYIPGSYVRLINGEISVVVKRGENAHTPLVASLVGIRGAPIQDPVLRDTSEPSFEIKEGISAKDVRVRTSWEDLLNQFF